MARTKNTTRIEHRIKGSKKENKKQSVQATKADNERAAIDKNSKRRKVTVAAEDKGEKANKEQSAVAIKESAATEKGGTLDQSTEKLALCTNDQSHTTNSITGVVLHQDNCDKNNIGDQSTEEATCSKQEGQDPTKAPTDHCSEGRGTNSGGGSDIDSNGDGSGGDNGKERKVPAKTVSKEVNTSKQEK